MSDSTCLLSLGDNVLSHVVSHLTLADILHLSCTCHDLRRICCKGVKHVLLTQQDLEEFEPLSVFSNAKHITLHEIHFCEDLVSFLVANYQPALQQLVSIRLTNPSRIDSRAVATLLETCQSLASLSLHGCWDSDDMQSLSQHPCSLQRLTIQGNSMLSLTDLLAWLASLSCSSQSAPEASQTAVNFLTTLSTAGSPQQQQQQVHNSSCSSTCRAGRNGNSEASQFNQMYRLLEHEAAAAGQQTLQTLLAVNQLTWLQLQELNLSGCSRLGGNWGFLALCPNLRSLNLHSCYKVTNETLQTFNKAVQTVHDDHRGTTCCSSIAPGSDAAGSAAAAAAGTADACAGRTLLPLQQLDISYTRVSDGGMPHLSAALPQLRRLCLKGCNVGDDGLDHLLQLQQLTALHVKHCHRITEEGIQKLSALSQLQELSFGYTSMPEADQVASAIAAQFKQLTDLDFLSSELTDAGLDALGTLQHLQQLKLYQATVSSKGLEDLAHSPAGRSLESLVLYGIGGLNDLDCLGCFQHLNNLQLGSLCDLHDVHEAVQQLTNTKQLQTLVLERMDGVSLQTLRKLLSGCQQLKLLRIRGCDGVALEQAEQFARNVAAWCRSSASIRWAAAAPCDTDDEDDGDQLVPA